VLEEADIPAKVFGAEVTTHSQLNANLGLPDDPATKELFNFLDPLVGQGAKSMTRSR
jgi:arylformamidase